MSSVENLVDLLLARADSAPSATAYAFLADVDRVSETLSYGELERRARAVAAALQRSGGAGERVLLLTSGGLEFICGFFGCLLAGARAVPSDLPRKVRRAGRLQAIAADARPRIVLAGAGTPEGVREMLEGGLGGEQLGWLELEDALAEDGGGWRPRSARPSEVAFLQYTSGSTGVPQGVMVSHANLLHNLSLIRRAFRLTERSVVLGWLPLFHDMGLIGVVLESLYLGAPCYLMTPLSFLQRPLRWLRAISEHGVTYSGGPNFAYGLCAEKVTAEERRRLDLSRWDVAFNGSEPVRGETLELFARTFASCGFRREAFQPCYGLAEATLAVSLGRPDGTPPLARAFDSEGLQRRKALALASAAPGARTLVGCGQVPRELDVEIVHPESSRPCGPDEIGEIWVAGPSVAEGYWNRDDLNDRLFRARRAGESRRRFLRTGDLGFLHQDELFIAGRLKDLLIVRGRNHYPQDVERVAEESHRAIRGGSVAAVAVERGGEERLAVVAEVKRTALRGDLTEVSRAVRQAIVEEEELVPCAILLLEPGRLPKTTSGKVRRQECRRRLLAGELRPVASWEEAPEDASAAEGPGLAADTGGLPSDRSGPGAVEDRVRSAVAAVLRAAPGELDGHLPLTAWGLDSLRAVALRAHIEAELGVEVPLATLFEGPTLEGLAARVREALDEGPAPVPGDAAGAVAEPRLALSEGQKTLWFLHQLDPSSAGLNAAVALRVRAPLEPDAGRRAFLELLERHEQLRCTFSEGADGPTVACAPASGEALEWVPAGRLDEPALAREIRSRAARPFDLEAGPLFRASVFSRGGEEHVLLLVAHHIVTDFWSQVLILRDLAALWSRAAAGRPPDPLGPRARYEDFVRWQEGLLAGPAGERHWRYWRNRLQGELPVLALPTDRPRPAVRGNRGASLDFSLGRELSARLGEIAHSERATPHMLLLAAYFALLHRYTGDEDLAVGSPMSGRTRRRFEEVVGYFMNPVVLRCDLGGDPRFLALLAQVRGRVVEALEHQDFPTHVLVERLAPARVSGLSPLFQTMFVWNRPQDGVSEGLERVLVPGAEAGSRLGDWDVEAVPLGRASALMDLVLYMGEADGNLTGRLEFDRDLFDATSMERLLAAFRELLEGLSANPGLPVGAIPMLPESDRRSVLEEWCFGPPRPQERRPLPEVVSELADRLPDRCAVLHETGRWSYRDLEEFANRLACHLRSLGVGPEVAVAVCLPRCPELVASLLAVWKAGGAYVPLDPSHPGERLAWIIGDAGVRVLVTMSEVSSRLDETGASVVHLDLDEGAIAEHAGRRLAPTATPENLAYVIYTSGSTGRPKGVAVPHGAVAHFARAAQSLYELGPTDRVLQFASIGFDTSVEEIFPILCSGGGLVLRPDWALDSFSALFRFCESTGVTTLDLPTAYWHEMVLALASEGLDLPSGVTRVILGGEAAALSRIGTWHELAPSRVRLWNTYGPTEATVIATAVRLVPGTDPEAPIGSPIPNARAHVVDAGLRPVGVGVPGELLLGGAGLARGYIGRPALTAVALVPAPFGPTPGDRAYRTGDRARWRADGLLEFLGRLDDQVKIRGFRIEPREVEATLRQHPDVLEAVVGVWEPEPGVRRLVAHVVLEGGAAFSEAELREFLHEQLPDYMVPARFVVVSGLPLTENGKVDRRALPVPVAPAASGPGTEAPRNRAEEALASAFRRSLGIEHVGIHDNFFALGGDSILGIQVIARARREGFRLKLTDLFQYQTIARLAEVARAARSAREEVGAEPGPVPLTPYQAWFFARDMARPEHWNMALHLEPRRRLEPRRVAAVLRHLSRHHDGLHLRFHRAADGWSQVQAEAGEVGFTRVDLARRPRLVRGAALAAISAQLQTGLDLARGPLLRAALLDAGEEGPQRLLLVAHHMVIDGVSWRVLLEDFQLAYEQASAGAPIRLPAKTTSYRRWAERLERYARSPALRSELDHWRRAAAAPLDGAAPVELAPETVPATEGDARVVTTSLDRETTRAVLLEVPRAFSLQINDVLVAALGWALSRDGGSTRLRLDLEGHGREDLFEDVDLSRTVGCCTAVAPLELDLSAVEEPAEALAVARDELARLPRGGIGYGILRYLGRDPAVREERAGWRDARVSFNYLGNFDGLGSESGFFRFLEERIGPVRHRLNRMPYLLEILAWSVGARLTVRWTYSGRHYAEATVRQWAESYRRFLRDLTRPGSEVSPPASDLLDGVSMASLEHLFEQFGRTPR